MYLALLTLVQLSVTCLSTVQGRLPDYPKWPVTCELRRYVGSTPRSSYYLHILDLADEDECVRSCKPDSKCGLYVWVEERKLCWKLQHSVKMWEEAGIPTDDVLKRASGYTTGSRECRELTVHEECDQYRYTAGKLPSSGYITQLYTSSTSLNISGCEKICSKFSRCRSVTYVNQTKCTFYSTTLSAGATNCSSSLCGTYERQCEYPYDPNTYGVTTTTTSLPTTTDLSRINTSQPLSPTGPIHNLVNGWSFVGSSDSYVRSDVAATNMPALELTIIFWLKLLRPSTSNDETLVSYATRSNENHLVLWCSADSNEIVLWLNDESSSMPFASQYVNNWVHVSLSWRSSTGSVKLYLDGELEDEGTIAKGITIPSGGAFILGQDQDSLLGGFQLKDSFNGQLVNFHLFSTELPHSVIRAIYEGDDARCGDVVGCDPTAFTIVGDNVKKDFIRADIDECMSNITHNCDTNAYCTNTLGSFDCTCNDGYFGNGTSCAGILVNGWSFVGSIDSYVRSEVAARNIGALEFTITVWMRLIRPSNTGEDAIVSYATSENTNQLLVVVRIDQDRIDLHLNGVWRSMVLPRLSDYTNNWVHVSLSWRSSTGSANLYLDGELEDEGTIAKGRTIPNGGAFILGQDQDDRLLGGFQLKNSLNGQLVNFHLFSTVLPDKIIRAIYEGDDARCGDVVGCDPTAFTIVGDNVKNDLLRADIDECMSNITHNCDTNAYCTNSIGSFDCTCKDGYFGNGTSCAETFTTGIFVIDPPSLNMTIVISSLAVLVLGLIIGLVCTCWRIKSQPPAALTSPLRESPPPPAVPPRGPEVRYTGREPEAQYINPLTHTTSDAYLIMRGAGDSVRKEFYDDSYCAMDEDTKEKVENTRSEDDLYEVPSIRGESDHHLPNDLIT